MTEPRPGRGGPPLSRARTARIGAGRRRGPRRSTDPTTPACRAAPPVPAVVPDRPLLLRSFSLSRPTARAGAVENKSVHSLQILHPGRRAHTGHRPPHTARRTCPAPRSAAVRAPPGLAINVGFSNGGTRQSTARGARDAKGKPPPPAVRTAPGMHARAFYSTVRSQPRKLPRTPGVVCVSTADCGAAERGRRPRRPAVVVAGRPAGRCGKPACLRRARGVTERPPAACDARNKKGSASSRKRLGEREREREEARIVVLARFCFLPKQRRSCPSS